MNYTKFLSVAQQGYLKNALEACKIDDIRELESILVSLTDAAWDDGHRCGFKDGIEDAKEQQEDANQLRGF